MTRKVRDRLLALSAEAAALADEMDPEDHHDSGNLAIDVMRGLVPAAHLRSSRAQDGTWWAYLVMPCGWSPASRGRWIYNESAGYYWADASATTEDEALRKALRALLDA